MVVGDGVAVALLAPPHAVSSSAVVIGRNVVACIGRSLASHP